MLDNIGFRNFLELVPEARGETPFSLLIPPRPPSPRQHHPPPQVRELIHHFHESRYAACLAGLDRLRPAAELDLHLREHVGPLWDAIRQRALVQYASPFTAAHLGRMAAAFNTSVPGLEKELAGLIMEGAIQARRAGWAGGRGGGE